MQLRAYLAEAKTSIPSFAELLGVSVQAVHRYAAGERTPRAEVMERIRLITGGKVQPNDLHVAVQQARSAKEIVASPTEAAA